MLNGKAAIVTGSTDGIGGAGARSENAMDSRYENLIAVPEPDSADTVEACAKPVQASAPAQQPQPSILELNSIFFSILTGLATVFTVAAFLVSTR